MSPLLYTLAISSVALLLPRDGVEAFVQPRANILRTGNSYAIMSKTVMSASIERRAFVSRVVSGGLVGALALGSTTKRATAYEKEYLKEPTEEFKAMEARQSEFAAAQRAYKQDFLKKLDAFLAATTDEEAVVALNVLSNTVIKRGGLPESVRINDLLKTCRRKKAAMKDSGKWGTPVQIAYEALVQTTNKTVIPLQSG